MKENRIEDRINNAYCFLNSMHSDFRTGLYYKEDLENLEHILSDYKRVLKENEELKDTNCLVKRYFKLKDTNTYLQKENKNLKEFRRRFVYATDKELQEANEYFLNRYTFKGDELAVHINTLLKATNSSIPVKKVKDKIEKEIKYHEKNILDIENITMLKSKTAKEEVEIEFNKYAIVVLNKMLQELLEESEEK